jgi:Heavy metal associated domain 2
VTHLRARVASHTPGRLRVRVEPSERQPRAMRAVRERLDAAIGPGHTEVNPSTGSVLVHYDHHTRSSADVISVLRDVGVLVEETARSVLDLPEAGAGPSTTSVRLIDTMTDLDRQISLLTGRRVDLKLLFPMALGGVGLWRVATNGLGLTEVPAYVLLWYAFDSFWKFHREPAQGVGTDASA